MVDLGADLHRLGERARPYRGDHELLEVDRVLGVDAAVQNVHRRHRQQRRLVAGQVSPERLTRFGRRGAREGHRDPEYRVGAESRLALGSIELDQGPIKVFLVGNLPLSERVGDLTIDVRDRLRHALAAKGAIAAVPQFERLTSAGGGA